MKVKGVDSAKISRIAPRGGPRSRARIAYGSAPHSESDNVAVSPEGRLIGMAGEIAAETSDIRQERIQPIIDALAAGRYDISSLDVADKILRQMLRDRKRTP
ncbi:MAG: flagellar biosynthesis anti-sigma factor FlgM [Magnetococcales bacterium]|nr:flagellar biosynthesis anti-sigma factor FlgM [Magnetococcales bacterium]